MKRVLYSAAVLSVSFSSFCYSDTDIVNGITGNAAINGLQWNMDNVLPPQAGLTVGGITYRYTTRKEIEDAFRVTIENVDKINGGNVFEHTDDWSGLPGNTIRKTLPLDDISIDRIGDGQIRTEGVGEVVDPTVRYYYTYDECYDVLSNPECPGWAEAYLKYLMDNGLIEEVDASDPYWDELVQSILNEKTDKQEDENEEEVKEEDEEEEEEDNTERLLSISDEVNKIADSASQDAMLQALSQVQKLDTYITKQIEGGTYQDSVELKDKKINDNRGAAVRMGLAQDKVHNEMVNSQYKDN